MKRLASLTLLLALCLLPSSCIWQQQQQKQGEETKEQEEKLLPPQHLGAVHQVYPEQGFALLRIIGPLPGPGTTLITHPADGSASRIGNLCIASQQVSRDGIIAADIRSGLVLKGDRVFRYRNISSADEGGDVIVAERPAGLADAERPATGTEAPIPAPETASGDTPADIPDPAGTTVETTVLPTTLPDAPGSESNAPATPYKAPDYLNSIPDDISAWD